MPVINTTRRIADAGEIGGSVKKPATQSRPTTSSKPATSVLPRGQANTQPNTSASKAPTTVVDFRGSANTNTSSSNASAKVGSSLNANQPGNTTSTIGKSPAPKAEVELRNAIKNASSDFQTTKKLQYADANWKDEEFSDYSVTKKYDDQFPEQVGGLSDCLAACQNQFDSIRSSGIGLAMCQQSCWNQFPQGYLGPLSIFGVIDFPQMEYPDPCGNRTAEECLLYHLGFLVQTQTIQGMGPNISLYEDQVFASFVAPDALNPHRGLVPGHGGTPADIKGMYQHAYGSEMTLFGNTYNFDFSGNFTFGYIGTAAGFPEGTLLFDADVAQRGDTGTPDPLYDQIAVSAGVALYQYCGQDCSNDDVEHILSQFYSDYANALASGQ